MKTPAAGPAQEVVQEEETAVQEKEHTPAQVAAMAESAAEDIMAKALYSSAAAIEIYGGDYRHHSQQVANLEKVREHLQEKTEPLARGAA